MNLFSSHPTNFGTLAIDDDGEEVLEEFQFRPDDASERGDRMIAAEEARIESAIGRLFSETSEEWHLRYLGRTDALNRMISSTLPAFNNAVYDSLFRSNSIFEELMRSADRRANVLQQKIDQDLLESAMRMPPEIGEKIAEIITSPPRSATEILVGMPQPNNWLWDQAAYPDATTFILKNSQDPWQGQSIDAVMIDQMEEIDPAIFNRIDRSTYSSWRNAAQVAPPFNGLEALRRMFDSISGRTENAGQRPSRERIFREGIVFERRFGEKEWKPLVTNAGVRSLLDAVSSTALHGTPQST